MRPDVIAILKELLLYQPLGLEWLLDFRCDVAIWRGDIAYGGWPVVMCPAFDGKSMDLRPLVMLNSTSRTASDNTSHSHLKKQSRRSRRTGTMGRRRMRSGPWPGEGQKANISLILEFSFALTGEHIVNVSMRDSAITEKPISVWDMAATTMRTSAAGTSLSSPNTRCLASSRDSGGARTPASLS